MKHNHFSLYTGILIQTVSIGENVNQIPTATIFIILVHGKLPVFTFI